MNTKQEVEAAMNLRTKGEAMIDILRLTVRHECKQNYNLDLGEMYTLMDYTSHLRECIENQKVTIAKLQGMEQPLKLSDLIERVSESESEVK